ncbi:NUDIX hydrolase [Sinorhizobium sp. Sb3]|uniref:NUDIX hydrolase n=1 Tax=Sinorhizobium sp. Sb3 TaxID=1358417 RepID=UPI000AD5C06A|nr:NUDIX hydrolase [Sinorhizobium sp. Sb3]
MSAVRSTYLSGKMRLTGRAVRPDFALQYGAICLRYSPDADFAFEVLIITSRDTGRWIIPKGWGMAKKSSFQVAKEEAWQEAGVKGRVWKKSVGAYEYGKVLENGEVVHAQVRVHLILVSRSEESFPEKGQRTLRWCSPAEAAEAVDERDLKKLFEKVPDEVGKLLRRGFKQR